MGNRGSPRASTAMQAPIANAREPRSVRLWRARRSIARASSPPAPDELDWDDEIRIALEERAASRPTR